MKEKHDNPQTPGTSEPPADSIPQLDPSSAIFINMIPDLMCIASADGYFKQLNPAWEEVLGYSIEELKSRPYSEFVLPEDLERTAREHEEEINGKAVHNFINRYRCKDGSVRWLEWRGKATEDQQYVLAVARDITERQAALELVQQHEDIFQALTGSSRDAMIMLDHHGNITFWNIAAENIFGYSAGEVAGKNLHDFLVPEKYRAMFRNGFTHFQRTGQGDAIGRQGLEMTGIHKNGREIPVELSLSAIRIRDEWRSVGIIHDITERKRIEDELKKSELKLKTILDHSGDGINMLDLATGRYVFMNPSQVRLTGFTMEEINNISAEEAYGRVHPDDRHISVEQQRVISEGKEKTINTEYRWKVKSGEYRWFSDTRTLINDEKGNIVSMIGISRDITENKKIENDLRESEHNYRTLIETMEDMIVRFDRQYRFLFLSPSVNRLFNISPEQVIGKTSKELGFSPEQYQQFENLMEKVFLSGESHTEIQQIFGGKHWFNLTLVPEKGKNGEVTSVLIYFRDITEIIKNQLAIKASEEKFREIFENIRDVYIQTDLGGTFIEVSPSVGKIFQYTREELIGKSTNLIHTNPLNREYIIGQIKEHGEMNSFELLMKKKDGTHFWVSANIHAHRDADGRIFGMAGMLRDINNVKMSEEALKESESLFRSVFELPLIGAAVTSPEKGWIEVNDALLTMLGYSREELVQKTWVDITHPEDLVEDIAMFDLLTNGEIDKYILEKRYITKWGEPLWTIISVACARKPDRSIDYFVAFVQDISRRKQYETELKESETRLQELNATKDKFFSIIAHDLRSPFTGFLGLVKILQEEILDLTLNQIREHLQSIDNSAESLFRLLENLLEWARLQRGLSEPDPKSFPIKFKSKLSSGFVKETASTKKISICCEVPDNLMVYADENMTESIFRNLLSNAIKFTPSGGEITISAQEVPGNKVEIAIRDTGIGMNETIRQKLFRIDAQTNRKGTDGEPSSGLGLILVKEFVEKNGGTLRVESEEGKGSTICFTLPSKPTDDGRQAVLPATTPNVTKQISDEMIALVVEDDPGSRVFLSVLLKNKFGIRVFETSSGTTAIDLCRNNPGINLILMDITMPGIDGFETTREIRKLNSKAIIIFQTSWFNAQSRAEALAAGCDGYILKPIDPDELSELIHKFFHVDVKTRKT